MALCSVGAGCPMTGSLQSGCHELEQSHEVRSLKVLPAFQRCSAGNENKDGRIIGRKIRKDDARMEGGRCRE